MSDEILRPGNVLRYVPRGGTHARECTAFVNERGVAVDTYWRAHGDGQSHWLRPGEVATASVLFNVGDFDALDYYAATSRSTWESYHPDDRARITSQHGLQEQLYVRRGAKPCVKTQVENARASVEVAESKVRSAESYLQAMRERLAEAEERLMAGDAFLSGGSPS